MTHISLAKGSFQLYLGVLCAGLWELLPNPSAAAPQGMN